MENTICQSCAMLFEYGKRGKNADGTESADYCEHCFINGEFNTPDMTMEKMIEVCIPYRVPHVYPDAETARKAMQEFYPTLKRWS